MHVYFHNGTISSDFLLNEVESHHAVKVMRTKVGDSIKVINGQGSISICEVAENHPKHCKLKVLSTQFSEKSPKNICIAIAPTKSNDRIEWFIEKATEIGISELYPLLCKNGERAKVNLERWKKIVIAATKQSQRAWKPIVHQPIAISELIHKATEKTKLLAYCENLPDRMLTEFAASESVLLLIGPEGDFTPEEVNEAIKHHFITVSLGGNRLRTETAGVVGATLLCLAANKK